MDDFFARNRLSAWLDGELSAAEAREVEDALTRSPELRAELEQLRATVKMLRDGGPVPAPVGFADRLHDRLRKEPTPVGWTRHLRKIRLEAFMLAAAAAMVLVLASRAREPAPVEQGIAQAAGPAVDAAAMPGTDAAPPPADVPEPTPMAEADPPVAKKAGNNTKLAARPSSKTSGEKEPFVASWEAQAEVPPVVHSPAQFRLRPTSETGLRDLEALAASLGGKLTDARGKPMAAYPLESGEHKTVKLVLPSMAVGEVASRLAELGQIEVVNVTERTLYANGTVAPIVIEVYRD